MSKETKLAKKEAKAAKKAAKLEKSQAAAYAKMVKKIEKKNTKLEKKSNKKGKPFEPIAVPTMEEAFAGAKPSKAKNIIKMIILILLIWYLIYFLVMWFQYVAPVSAVADDEETTEEAESATYERYSNPHEITTTPTYSVDDASKLLKQVLHDNYKKLGYSSDPSSSAVSYTGGNVEVNNADCYVFSASGKTYCVASNLSAVYLSSNGEYTPITFDNVEDYLFTE